MKKVKHVGRVFSKIEFLTLGLGVSFLIFMGVYIYDMSKNPNDYIGASVYDDKYLNFSLLFPADWQLIKADDETMAEVIQETTGGVLFDNRYSKLSTEVTPITLVKESEKGGKALNKITFFAFFGVDSVSNYMIDIEAIENELEENLVEMGAENIKVVGSEERVEQPFYGWWTTATAEINDQQVYFTQYVEPAGQNILRIVHSSTVKGEADYDVESFLSGLTYEDTNLLENQTGITNPNMSIDGDTSTIINNETPDSEGINITPEVEEGSTINPTEWSGE